MLALLCFGLHACKHSDGPFGPNPLSEGVSPGIVPLKVGYYWNYKEYILNQDGTTGAQIDAFNYQITTTSMDPTGLIQEPMFERITFAPSVGMASDFVWLYRNYDDGLYLMGGIMPTDSVFMKLPLLRYPAKPGDSCIHPHLVYDLLLREYIISDSVLYTCVDTSATFETPLGTFQCVVYFHREDLEEDVLAKWDHYDYYAPGIGLVGATKYDFFEHTGESFPHSKTVLVETDVQGEKQ